MGGTVTSNPNNDRQPVYRNGQWQTPIAKNGKMYVLNGTKYEEYDPNDLFGLNKKAQEELQAKWNKLEEEFKEKYKKYDEELTIQQKAFKLALKTWYTARATFNTAQRRYGELTANLENDDDLDQLSSYDKKEAKQCLNTMKDSREQKRDADIDFSIAKHNIEDALKMRSNYSRNLTTAQILSS